MSVVFFVSSPAEIFQDYHPIVAIVRFTSGRLDGNVRRHTAKENGVRLDRSQDCLQRGRVERTDAVLGDEEIRVGLVQRLVDFRCPSTKMTGMSFVRALATAALTFARMSCAFTKAG